jgi:choline dehydrogenase-like flavoprotein
MDPEVDIAVVGGGVVGCTLASALARAKHSVILLEGGVELLDRDDRQRPGVDDALHSVTSAIAPRSSTLHAAIASCSTGPNGVDGPYS